VIVVEGDPAGLSAALFTAKNDLETVVFDTDETWLHKAHLFNYLGIESVDGTAFMEDSRSQVAEFGDDLRRTEVASVESTAEGFVAATGDGDVEGRYLVLATAPIGASPRSSGVRSTATSWT